MDCAGICMRLFFYRLIDSQHIAFSSCAIVVGRICRKCPTKDDSFLYQNNYGEYIYDQYCRL